MADRLDRAAERAGIGPADRARLRACFEHSLERRTGLGDQRHPEYLHGGRTALILIEDIATSNADAIALATLLDSRRPAFQPGLAEIERRAGPRAAALARQLPRHGADVDATREALVTAEPAAALAALAETLDHARHLHLEPPGEWAAYHTIIEMAWLPVAHRTHPQLARRFDWWTDMFRRRYLA